MTTEGGNILEGPSDDTNDQLVVGSDSTPNCDLQIALSENVRKITLLGNQQIQFSQYVIPGPPPVAIHPGMPTETPYPADWSIDQINAAIREDLDPSHMI